MSRAMPRLTSLAMLQVIITTHVAYAACVVLGGVLLQIAPVSSFGRNMGMNSVARGINTGLEGNFLARHARDRETRARRESPRTAVYGKCVRQDNQPLAREMTLGDDRDILCPVQRFPPQTRRSHCPITGRVLHHRSWSLLSHWMSRLS